MDFRRRRASLVDGIGVGGVLMAVVAAAVLIPASVIWIAAAPTVADHDTTVSLQAHDATADITVPAGWSHQAAFGDASRSTLRSPDGVMTVQLRLLSESDAATAVTAAAPGTLGPMNREPSGSATLLHARTREGGVLVGALSSGDAVLTFTSSPSPEYDADLARLLAGVQVGS